MWREDVMGLSLTAGVHVEGGRDRPLTHCRCACCAHMSSEYMHGFDSNLEQQIIEFVLQQ